MTVIEGFDCTEDRLFFNVCASESDVVCQEMVEMHHGFDLSPVIQPAVD